MHREYLFLVLLCSLKKVALLFLLFLCELMLAVSSFWMVSWTLKNFVVIMLGVLTLYVTFFFLFFFCELKITLSIVNTVLVSWILDQVLLYTVSCFGVYPDKLFLTLFAGCLPYMIGKYTAQNRQKLPTVTAVNVITCKKISCYITQLFRLFYISMLGF